MTGNVWELCSDWYANYPAVSVTDPQGPGLGFNSVNRGRVVRGGSWREVPRFCRAAHRDWYAVCVHSFHLGFRPSIRFEL